MHSMISEQRVWIPVSSLKKKHTKNSIEIEKERGERG